MSAPYACFEKIIGLSRTDCECFNTGMPVDASESASGLFLDETPGLTLDVIKAAASCATGGDGWKLMQTAVAEGVKRYTSETLKYIRANTEWKRVPVRSQVGDTENSRKEVTANKTYHGMSLLLPHHVGGWARVKRIGTYFKQTGTINLGVYGRDSDTPIETFALATEANRLKWTDVDVLLSMEVEGSLNPKFWFLFDTGTSTGGNMLNSRIHCGCGGTRKYENQPWFESSVKANDKAWMKWAEAGGVSGTTLSEREDWSSYNETQGIVLDIEFGCTAQHSLCTGNPDYDNDPVQMGSAYAVRFAAAAYIVSQIIASTNVNRETLTGGDNFYQLRGGFEKRFYEYAHEFIGATLVQPHDEGDPHSGVNSYSDCFTCKDVRRMKVSTMLR